MKNLPLLASETSHRFLFINAETPKTPEKTKTLSELEGLKDHLSQAWKKEAKAGGKPDVATWEGVHQVDKEVMRRSFHIEKVDGGYVVEMDGTGIFSDERSEVFSLEAITTDFIDKKVQELLDDFKKSEKARAGTKLIDNEGIDITDLRAAEVRIIKQEKQELTNKLDRATLPDRVPDKFKNELDKLNAQKEKIEKALKGITKVNLKVTKTSVNTYVDRVRKLKNDIEKYNNVEKQKVTLSEKLKNADIPKTSAFSQFLKPEHQTLTDAQSALESELENAKTPEEIKKITTEIKAHLKKVEAFKIKIKDYPPENYSTIDQVSGSIEDVLARMAKKSKYKRETKTQILKLLIKKDAKLKIKIKDADSHLRLRADDGKKLAEGKQNAEVVYQGEVKEDGAKRLWLKVELDGKTGWMAANYLGMNLKAVDTVTPTPPIETTPPQTGLDGGGSAETPAEVVSSSPAEVPAETPETLNFDDLFNIQVILPEYAQYVSLNPSLPGWMRYTEAFNRVPLGKQREIKIQIQKALQEKLESAFNGGIDAKIVAAKTANNAEKIAYFSAMKLLSPFHGGRELSRSRALLGQAGKEGKEILDLMNHDAERVRQGQMLAMFEAIESSKHESIMDDSAIFKWASDRDEMSQKKINLIHKVSPIVQEVFNKQGNTIATITASIKALINNEPPIRPRNISEKELKRFRSIWKNFLEGKTSRGASELRAIDVTENDFMGKLASGTQQKWLDIAKGMEKRGQHDQAQQIVEQMVFGIKDGDHSVGEKLESHIESSDLIDIKTEVQKMIDKEMPKDQLLKMYEEQGYFTDEGLAGFGLEKQADGNFLDAINEKEVSRSQAMDLIVENSIKITKEKLLKEKMLFAVCDDDLIQTKLRSNFVGVEQEALTLYKEISGAGDTGRWDIINMSSKKADFWQKEIIINVGLIAASAAGVGLLGLGARAVEGISLAARSEKVLGLVGKMAEVGTKGSRFARIAGAPIRNMGSTYRGLAEGTGIMSRTARWGAKIGTVSAVDGFAFHNINAALSTPIVGTKAWDNYGEGVKHSIGTYLALGAGNSLWAKGMEGIAAGGGKMVPLAERSIQTLSQRVSGVSGLKDTTKEVILSTLSNQPKLALEAMAFTHMSTDAEFGSAEYMEEFGKQLVTMNLLWGMPEVGGKTKPEPNSNQNPPGLVPQGKPRQAPNQARGRVARMKTKIKDHQNTINYLRAELRSEVYTTVETKVRTENMIKAHESKINKLEADIAQIKPRPESSNPTSNPTSNPSSPQIKATAKSILGRIINPLKDGTTKLAQGFGNKIEYFRSEPHEKAVMKAKNELGAALKQRIKAYETLNDKKVKFKHLSREKQNKKLEKFIKEVEKADIKTGAAERRYESAQEKYKAEMTAAASRTTEHQITKNICDLNREIDVLEQAIKDSNKLNPSWINGRRLSKLRQERQENIDAFYNSVSEGNVHFPNKNEAHVVIESLGEGHSLTVKKIKKSGKPPKWKVVEANKGGQKESRKAEKIAKLRKEAKVGYEIRPREGNVIYRIKEIKDGKIIVDEFNPNTWKRQNSNVEHPLRKSDTIRKTKSTEMYEKVDRGGVFTLGKISNIDGAKVIRSQMRYMKQIGQEVKLVKKPSNKFLLVAKNYVLKEKEKFVEIKKSGEIRVQS